MVPGTRSDGSAKSRAGGISFGLFKGQGREIGTRKQQGGERRAREGREKGEARELLVSVLVGVGGEGRAASRRREMVVAN